MANIKEAINENAYDMAKVSNGAVYLSKSRSSNMERVVFWLKDVQRILSSKYVPYSNSPEIIYSMKASGYNYDITGDVFNILMNAMMGGEVVENKPEFSEDLQEYMELLSDWIALMNGPNEIGQRADWYLRWTRFINHCHDFDVIAVPSCNRTQVFEELARVKGGQH